MTKLLYTSLVVLLFLQTSPLYAGPGHSDTVAGECHRTYGVTNGPSMAKLRECIAMKAYLLALWPNFLSERRFLSTTTSAPQLIMTGWGASTFWGGNSLKASWDFDATTIHGFFDDPTTQKRTIHTQRITGSLKCNYQGPSAAANTLGQTIPMGSQIAKAAESSLKYRDVTCTFSDVEVTNLPDTFQRIPAIQPPDRKVPRS